VAGGAAAVAASRGKGTTSMQESTRTCVPTGAKSNQQNFRFEILALPRLSDATALYSLDGLPGYSIRGAEWCGARQVGARTQRDSCQFLLTAGYYVWGLWG